MIKLSNDINKTAEEIKEFKRLTADNPKNWNIPTNYGLTGRQAYVQFCMRMAKFDMEFATLDPVMASSWLNIGMTRICHEFEKRLLANPGDRCAYVLFKEFISEDELEKKSSTEPYEYTYDMKAAAQKKKLLPEALHIYGNPTWECADSAPEMVNIPTWWPYYLNSGKWVARDLPLSYIELEGIDEASAPFWTSNSFSESHSGVNSKVWIKRDPPEFPIHIYVNSYRNTMRGTDGFINRGAVPPYDNENKLIHITKVTVIALDYDKFMTNKFIDTSSKDPIDIPTEYHHDIADYAIDAYFESMFFHQFGKYSMRQGRQDADGSSQTASRQSKLDAVPPQRYRVGANA